MNEKYTISDILSAVEFFLENSEILEAKKCFGFL